jgi:hypothetical protein
MIEKYFLSRLKINAKTSELVIPGEHINIDGYTYEQLSRKPKGRTIFRKLINKTNTERFTIYA